MNNIMYVAWAATGICGALSLAILLIGVVQFAAMRNSYQRTVYRAALYLFNTVLDYLHFVDNPDETEADEENNQNLNLRAALQTFPIGFRVEALKIREKTIK